MQRSGQEYRTSDKRSKVVVGQEAKSNLEKIGALSNFSWGQSIPFSLPGFRQPELGLTGIHADIVHGCTVCSALNDRINRLKLCSFFFCQILLGVVRCQEVID